MPHFLPESVCLGQAWGSLFCTPLTPSTYSEDSSGLMHVVLYALLGLGSQDPKCSDLPTHLLISFFLNPPAISSVISGHTYYVKLELNDVATNLSENAPGT